MPDQQALALTLNYFEFLTDPKLLPSKLQLDLNQASRHFYSPEAQILREARVIIIVATCKASAFRPVLTEDPSVPFPSP